jgi:hypothetical protein
LSGLHIDIIFEIGCSGTTAAAINCEKGKTGKKKLLRFLKNSHPLRPRFDVFKNNGTSKTTTRAEKRSEENKVKKWTFRGIKHTRHRHRRLFVVVVVVVVR